MSWSHWKDGTVTFWLRSGHVLTFDGGVRTARGADGYIADYEMRGGPNFVLLPTMDRIDAISVERPREDTDA